MIGKIIMITLVFQVQKIKEVNSQINFRHTQSALSRLSFLTKITDNMPIITNNAIIVKMIDTQNIFGFKQINKLIHKKKYGTNIITDEDSMSKFYLFERV